MKTKRFWYLWSVDEKLVQELKPHQKDGIQFMWNACFESCNKICTSMGGGCILAHCMGRGRSLRQTFSDKNLVFRLLFLSITFSFRSYSPVLWANPCKYTYAVFSCNANERTKSVITMPKNYSFELDKPINGWRKPNGRPKLMCLIFQSRYYVIIWNYTHNILLN